MNFWGFCYCSVTSASCSYLSFIVRSGIDSVMLAFDPGLYTLLKWTFLSVLGSFWFVSGMIRKFDFSFYIVSKNLNLLLEWIPVRFCILPEDQLGFGSTISNRWSHDLGCIFWLSKMFAWGLVTEKFLGNLPGVFSGLGQPYFSLKCLFLMTIEARWFFGILFESTQTPSQGSWIFLPWFSRFPFL